MKVLQLLLACGFIGWCLYAGIYVPAQHGGYASFGGGTRHEEAAMPDPATSVEDDGEAVGESDVGVDLSDDEEEGE